jgi:RNA polymerase sigma factor (sigma-70 family)
MSAQPLPALSGPAFWDQDRLVRELMALRKEAIRYMTYKMKIDKAMAEDLFSEYSLNMLQKGKYDPSLGSFKSFTYTCLHNLRINEQRRQKKVIFYSLPGTTNVREEGRDLFFEPAADGQDLEMKTDASLALQALDILPEFECTVLRMRAEGHPYEEIARHTRQPLGSIKSTIFRGRRIVAAALHKLGLGDHIRGLAEFVPKERSLIKDMDLHTKTYTRHFLALRHSSSSLPSSILSVPMDTQTATPRELKGIYTERLRLIGQELVRLNNERALLERALHGLVPVPVPKKTNKRTRSRISDTDCIRRDKEILFVLSQEKVTAFELFKRLRSRAVEGDFWYGLESDKKGMSHLNTALKTLYERNMIERHNARRENPGPGPRQIYVYSREKEKGREGM